MKIQSITTKYYPSVKKNNQKIRQTRLDKPQQNNIQSISFGLVPPVPPVPLDPITAIVAFVVTGLSMIGIVEAKDSYENFQEKRKRHKRQQNEYKKLVEKDIKKFKQLNNLSEEKALSAYTNRLRKVLIKNQELNRKKVGLNSLYDHDAERFQLFFDVILPLNDTKESKKLSTALPNGILINGKDNETNEKLTNALKEHISAMDIDVLEADLSSDDPQESLNNAKSAFENAFKHHKKMGGISLIHLKNIDNIMNSENDEVQDALKNYIESSVHHGAVVLYDTADIKQFNPALLRQGRTDVVINVRDY